MGVFRWNRVLWAMPLTHLITLIVAMRCSIELDGVHLPYAALNLPSCLWVPWYFTQESQCYWSKCCDLCESARLFIYQGLGDLDMIIICSHFSDIGGIPMWNKNLDLQRRPNEPLPSSPKTYPTDPSSVFNHHVPSVFFSLFRSRW